MNGAGPLKTGAKRARSPPPPPRGPSARIDHDRDRDRERGRPQVKREKREDINGTVDVKMKMHEDEDEDTFMKRVMGFEKFRSTKNTKVPGNQIYAVRKEKKTTYRQYMNRVGGFNRPLSPTR